MQKIAIVIDPAHRNWVLGGLFRDVHESDRDFFSRTKVISHYRSKYLPLSLFNILILVISKRPILFSSITPLENFTKLSKFKSNMKILWFTHQPENLSINSDTLVKKADLIFVHSKNEKKRLRSIGVTTPITVLVGAIRPELFSKQIQGGDKIVYIGTSSERKNTKIFLDFARKNPRLKFKILGKNWQNSNSLRICQSIKNVEFIGLERQISYHDLIGCSHHIVLSSVEGGPISLIESVAAGLIPICTNVGIASQFLDECGYKNQIIDFPITDEKIHQKLNNSYRESEVKYAREVALKYTVDLFSSRMKTDIIKYRFLFGK